VGGFDVIGDSVKRAVEGLTSAAGLSVLMFGLAFVFLWSGSAKLHSPSRAGAALRDFGLTSTVRPGLGAIAGAAEIVLAFGLAAGAVAAGLARPSLVLALLVLVAFAALQLRVLLTGRRFSCFCFGDETAELSWASLARVAGLVLVAVVPLAVSRSTEGQAAATIANEIVIAAAGIGLCGLLGMWPRLWRWQADPLGLRDELWIDRGRR
jgi:hypothetical protein